MIDFSAPDPFGLEGKVFPFIDLNVFSDEVEFLKPQIIAEAQKESEHCVAFVEYVFDFIDEDICVGAMFSATVFSAIIKACNRADDSVIKDFYLRMFQLVTPKLWEMGYFEHQRERTMDIFKRNKILPEDIPVIKSAIESLKRIPVALIVDRYLNAKPKQMRDYIWSSTYIYDTPDQEVDLSGSRIDPEMYEKLIGSLYRICNQLRHQARTVNRRSYRNLSWEAINAQEGTSFSQAFITWLKWATTDAKYIGTRERNDGCPSWCFAPYSMDVCYDKEELTGIGDLYDHLLDLLGSDREQEIRIPLVDYFYGHVQPDEIMYQPLFEEADEEENTYGYNSENDGPIEINEEDRPAWLDAISETDFVLLCQRIISEIDCGLTIDEKMIVLPPGKGIEKFRLIRKV